MRPGLAVTLYLRGERVVVVGSDPVATDRVRRLTTAGAAVEHIDAPSASADELRGARAVFAHTGDPEANARVVASARSLGALAYAHDQPDISDFAMPALVRRGPINIAISTSAVAPALSRVLRQRFEVLFDSAGEAFDRLVDDLAERRRRGERAGLYGVASALRLEGRLWIDNANDDAD